MVLEGDCIIEAGAAFLGGDSTEAVSGCAFRIGQGKIAEIAATEVLRRSHPDLPRHGGPGFAAMPGLVNSHHHFGVTPLMQNVPFAPLELWLPRFRGMRRLPTRLDTLFSAIEMLESGTTCVQHIHSGLAGPKESWQRESDDVLGAYLDIGMRAGFCFMVRDRNILSYRPDAETIADFPGDLRDWIAPQLAAADIPVGELMDFFGELTADWRRRAPDRVRINVAPANLHWCSDATLDRLFGSARDSGAQVHMHLLETERQALFAREQSGRSAVAHLHGLGVLGDNVTFGHGNWMTRADLDLLADCNCSICHNASSGLRLGSGIAPVNEMRARDVPVALGIDQSNIADDRDMLVEMKLAWALHRETGMFNDRPSAAQVLQMASEHGAKTVGFGDFAGRLETGYAADIVLFDRRKLERPAVSPDVALADTIVHRARSEAVSEVFVGGRKVVEGGRVTAIDRDAVMEEIAERIAAPLAPQERHAADMAGRLADCLGGEHGKYTPDTYRPYRYNALDRGS